MNLLKNLAIMALTGMATGLQAQEIATDSKSKPVFNYFGPVKQRLDLNGKDFSVSFGLRPHKIIYGWGADTNVIKKSAFFIQPAVLNASKLILLSEREKFRPGGKITFGYQMAVDTIREVYKGSTYSLGASVFGLVDNIKLYNTLNSSIENRNPYGFGADVNGTFFPAFFRKMVVAGTVGYTYGYNDESLLNYKSVSAAVISSDVVAFDKFDGKYGELKNDIQKLRIAVSLPFAFGRFNPVPYAVYNNTKGSPDSYIYGIYANVLAKKLNFSTFDPPTSFGIGFDWVHAGGVWSKANVFIRGSMSFGKF